MMKRGLSRSWYRFKNWFRTKPGPGEPLRFLCGSEEELRRVTTWLWHIYPQDIQSSGFLTVAYISHCDQELGAVEWRFGTRFEEYTLTEAERKLMAEWFAIVVKHNKFVWTSWDSKSNYQDQELEIWGYCHSYWPCCLRQQPGLPRLLDMFEFGNSIIIKIHPPSAHECAEALLALSEWLDGKVSDQEKRALLQLPDDVEV